MLTLAAGDTVAGQAGAASITYSLFGMEFAAGVESYKKLAQGTLSNSGAATIYTTPASTQTFVKSIHLANQGATAVSSVSLNVKGTAAANRITGAFTIPANGWAICEEDGWRIYDQSGALQVGIVPSMSYKYNISTAAADPGSGHVAFDNTTLTSAATMRISRTTVEGFVLAVFLQAMLNATPACQVIMKSADGSQHFSFLATGSTGFTDNGAYYTVTITPQAATSGFTDDQSFSMDFYRYGNDGQGVPTGGSNGQFLKKNSGTNFDTSWGDVRFPLLTADTTYYVRTDGNDSHTGLANTAAGAFLTIAKAMSVAGALDMGSFQLTISVQAGTYSEIVLLPRMSGALVPILTGVGDTTIVKAVSNNGGTPWQVNSMKLTNASGNLLDASNGGVIKFDNLNFGTSSGYQIICNVGSVISLNGTFTYRISGGAQYHCISNGSVSLSAGNVTLTGTPAFSGVFVLSNRVASILAFGMTFTGSATGQKYLAALNSIIDTNGGGVNYFPGSVAGAEATGGRYN